MPLNTPVKVWNGKRVWIVGASTGIGASLARALLRAGARLALSARRGELLHALAAEFPAGQTTVLPLDITDKVGLLAAWAALRERWGGCDVVVVMAGDYVPMGPETLEHDAAENLLRVNLHGPLQVLECVLPDLLAAGAGNIALVSSVAGYRGLPRSLVYGPGKAAVINLAESLYLEVQPKGLGVWLINPGFVATPLTAQNDFPMPCLITAEEAANEILRGFARGDFEIHFPKRFTRVLKLLRVLPYRWYFALVRRITL